MDNPEPASASNTPNGDLGSLNLSSGEAGSPRVTIDQLLMAGAHFGHLTQRWNPKMKRYIFMARNGIYLIDLRQTQSLIDSACEAMAKIAARGETVLFVGTKKSARDIVEAEAKRAAMPYITYRWLGGTLTNFATVRKSLKTLENFEKMATDGTYDNINKKEQLQVEKEKLRLMRNLGGIREMRRLPGAVFIVDTKREAIAVAEARKLNIPIFAIVDTNVDPELVDFPVPANDDAFKSIWLVARALSDAVIEGRGNFKDDKPDTEERDAASKAPRRDNQPRRKRRPEGGQREGGRGGRDNRDGGAGHGDSEA